MVILVFFDPNKVLGLFVHLSLREVIALILVGIERAKQVRALLPTLLYPGRILAALACMIDECGKSAMLLWL